jgi:nucleotide-binding universal stress UspA family protein
MYRKIMVPLDGSELAECVLPHAEAIAKGCGVAEVIFVRVVEPTHLPIGSLTDGSETFTEDAAERLRKQIDAGNESAAKDYLNQVVSRVKLGGAKGRPELLKGKAADNLAEYATHNDIDLIVIATHGRSGISRWAFGSVADRLLRSACVPVLMVRAPGCIPGF